MSDVTSGAVKVGDCAAASLNARRGTDDQVYVMSSLSGSDEPDPSSVTVVLSPADWSVPALAMGARLTCQTVMGLPVDATI